MASRYTKSPRSYSRKPQWLVIAGALATLVNTGMRLFKMFRGKPASTTTTRSTDPGEIKPPVSSAPPRGRAAPRSAPPADAPAGPVGTDGGIPDLFRNKVSDRIVQASGTVVKVLPDDEDTSDGSEQHQKFLVELADKNRTTIKICHNLKFGRVPVREGEVVSFRGEYEYTDFGGSVHWTHKDPRGTHEDGWIEYDGEQYG